MKPNAQLIGGQSGNDIPLVEEEAAAFLRRNRSTLRHWRSARWGPKFYRVGGGILYLREDLVEFLKRNCVETTDHGGR
jgi:hypothetical protein